MILALILAFYLVAGLGVARWLWTAGSRPYTWQRPLRIPKVVEMSPEDYGGSVGRV